MTYKTFNLKIDDLTEHEKEILNDLSKKRVLGPTLVKLFKEYVAKLNSEVKFEDKEVNSAQSEERIFISTKDDILAYINKNYPDETDYARKLAYDRLAKALAIRPTGYYIDEVNEILKDK